MIRCINIDWLECYCLEDSIGFPHDAAYFQRQGWHVVQREYGTPMYNEMFTLYDHYNEPFIEVRRSPKSTKIAQGIFSPYAAHVRLTNRACYFDKSAKILSDFLEQHGFAFQRISRIDLCLDFEKFDSGDKPAVFLQRFMQGRYAKINQSNIAARGLDQWDGRIWNSISWGSPKSLVKTRFYNKTMELKQKKDKPYIRQAWQMAALVDDWHTCEKTNEKGVVYLPEIWRLEFELKAQQNKWLQIEDYQGARVQKLSIKNTLDVYFERSDIFQVFLSLVQHYFHFKHLEYKHEKKALTAFSLRVLASDPLHPLARVDTPATRELQRKDRCRDKVLFNTEALSTFYKIEKTLTATPRNKLLDVLYKKIVEYRDTHGQPDLRQACNTIINHLEEEARINALVSPFTKQEIQIIRRIVQQRMKRPQLTYEEAKQEAEHLLQAETLIWANPY